MKCEYCDRINTPDADECAYCGAPLEKPPKKQKLQSFIDDSPLEAFIVLIGTVLVFGLGLAAILSSLT